MIVFRAILAVLLTVALAVSAWAHCCVGLDIETAQLHDSGDQHEAGGHDDGESHGDEGDCGASKASACDVIAQASAPQVPAVGPALASDAPSFVLVTNASRIPALAAVPRTYRPPPRRSQRFKDTYAKTGRLLV